jgi:hypothetical protein
MIGRYLLAAALILALLAGWLLVQAAARRYAARHPEHGAAREEGSGCGGCGGCAAPGQCGRDD